MAFSHFQQEAELVCKLTKLAAPWWPQLARVLSATTFAAALFILNGMMSSVAVKLLKNNLTATRMRQLQEISKAVHQFLSKPYEVILVLKGIFFIVAVSANLKLTDIYCDKNLQPRWFRPRQY